MVKIFKNIARFFRGRPSVDNARALAQLKSEELTNFRKLHSSLCETWLICTILFQVRGSQRECAVAFVSPGEAIALAEFAYKVIKEAYETHQQNGTITAAHLNVVCRTDLRDFPEEEQVLTKNHIAIGLEASLGNGDRHPSSRM